MGLVKSIRKTVIILYGRVIETALRVKTTGTGSKREKIVENEINITYVPSVARTRVVVIVCWSGRWEGGVVVGGTADRQACARQRKRF